MPTNETKSQEEIAFGSSTIETIDYSVFNFLKNDINLSVNTNKGFKEVPVIWLSAERAFQIKNDVTLRDKAGVLTLPIITIERTSMIKSLSRKGSIYGNIYAPNDERGGVITVAKQINQYKSSNFINADKRRRVVTNSEDSDHKKLLQTTRHKVNRGVNFAFKQKNPKIVYETLTVPLPVYVETTYSIRLRAEYQQQLNEMTTPFITRPHGLNYIHLQHEEHVFEGFLGENFSQNTNVSALGDEERKYETTVELRVLGYLIGDGPNQESPKVVRRQNAVAVRFPREHVIVGDIHEITSRDLEDPFYRE